MVPIITYGSEIWGPDVHKSIERVHYKFCKYQLGVGSQTAILLSWVNVVEIEFTLPVMLNALNSG